MPFPQNFIAELKARNPIENVISKYVALKRAGSNMVGLCPFHSERSPSFTVFSDNFHCFGCSAGGDVITFIMRIENLDYPDAVRHLAEMCSLNVPEDSYTKKQNTSNATLTREKAFEMNKLAARHFYNNLMSDDGKIARDYLDKRQMQRPTRIRFGIGYAKNSFNDLTDYLMEKGFTANEIKENFLCGISEKTNRPFDMYRNRIIVPIFDLNGNVVAFGGRVLDDSKPKYINTTNTVVYKKGRLLYGLNFAKSTLLGDNKESEEISYSRPGELIVCEGYMDVIAMHQAGFPNSVATLGTAITPDQARLISRYAKTVFLAYDSDSAGQNATNTAIKLLNEVGVSTKILKIDGAKDPDEYLKKFGPVSFSKMLHASEGQIDFKLNSILSKYNLSDNDEKYKALTESCLMLSTVYSEIKKEVYISRLSEMMGISKDAIKTEISRKSGTLKRKAQKTFNDDIQKKILKYDDKINPQAAVYSKEVSIEQRILGIYLSFPELFNDESLLSEDDFVTDFNKQLFNVLEKLRKSDSFDISALNEFYNPEQFAYILNIKQERERLTSNGLDVLKNQILQLKKMKNKKELSDLDLSDGIDKIRSYKMKGNNENG